MIGSVVNMKQHDVDGLGAYLSNDLLPTFRHSTTVQLQGKRYARRQLQLIWQDSLERRRNLRVLRDFWARRSPRISKVFGSRDGAV